MKLVNLFALLFLFTLLSCKEKDEIVSYPIVYSNFPITDNSIKAFTKNGEITDPNTVNYIKKQYGYLLTGMNSFSTQGDVVLTFLSPEKVKLRNFDSDYLDTLNLFKKENLIYLERKDTVSALVDLLFYSFNKLFNYKPLYYEEIPLPCSAGFCKAAKYKPCYYVKTDGENLILPMIDFIYRHQDICIYCVLKINNEFCRDSVPNIDAKDTVIVNEYYLKFKKQSSN